ncbi:DUF928 domain-containing protein [Leptolyngbya sp. AN02str]|uniref:DUF928 domain-containing protein n=1 Tax=Leptolyngbya sp. AN02str TaxID=3423363 RepID=UPI003D31F10D
MKTQRHFLSTFCRRSPQRARVQWASLLMAIASAVVANTVPLGALAQTYIPPDRGLPGRREGGGTRGCWSSASVQASQQKLTAIVPEQNFGYTLQEYPSFLVYIPAFFAEGAVAAEFLLTDEEDNELYKLTYRTSNISGLVRIDLPTNANLPALEAGKDYRWYFTLMCDEDDLSGALVVDSWIQRIEPTEAIATAIEQASPQDLPEIYAEAGIWYDAASQVANLSNMSNSGAVAVAWRNLLNSVGLESITDDIVGDSVTSAKPSQVEVGMPE